MFNAGMTTGSRSPGNRLRRDKAMARPWAHNPINKETENQQDESVWKKMFSARKPEFYSKY